MHTDKASVVLIVSLSVLDEAISRWRLYVVWERDVDCLVNCLRESTTYSRSPKNPTLQLFQKSSKSASTTAQRPIWNTFGTVAVREFWENGCMVLL